MKVKLYEATYEICDGHDYLITGRFWAETREEALQQFAEEANECFGSGEDDWFDIDVPFDLVEMAYDDRTLHLLKLERILDVGKLTRACQLALGYIDGLPPPPIMQPPDFARRRLRKALVAALGE